MNRRLFVAMSPILALGLALPAFGQNDAGSQANQASADRNEASSSAQQSQQDQHQKTMADRGEKEKISMAEFMSKLQQGGAEADQLQFELIESHLRNLDRSLSQLQRLSPNPEENAADIVRWKSVRDENADHVSGIVANYFLSQRLLPPDIVKSAMGDKDSGTSAATNQQNQSTSSSATASQSGQQTAQQGQYGSSATQSTQAEQASSQSKQDSDQSFQQAYEKQLETAHKIMVHAYLAKQTSGPEHVRDIRTLLGELRQGNTQLMQVAKTHWDQWEQRQQNNPSTSGVNDQQRQYASRGAGQDTSATPNASSGNTSGSTSTVPNISSNNSGASAGGNSATPNTSSGSTSTVPNISSNNSGTTSGGAASGSSAGGAGAGG